MKIMFLSRSVFIRVAVYVYPTIIFRFRTLLNNVHPNFVRQIEEELLYLSTAFDVLQTKMSTVTLRVSSLEKTFQAEDAQIHCIFFYQTTSEFFLQHCNPFIRCERAHVRKFLSPKIATISFCFRSRSTNYSMF